MTKPTFGETITNAVAARRQQGLQRIFGTPPADTETPDQAMLNRLFPTTTDTEGTNDDNES